VNAALSRATGFELRKAGAVPRRRAPRRGDRLLEAPAFIVSTVRSGSTLLRVLLDSHSQIHSPPELHLRDLAVQLKSAYAERSLAEIGLDATRLEHLLWDRVLHRELQDSGKRLLVNKTPNDVFIVDRIRTCWPDARFLFLLRHPAEIARSRQEVRPQDTAEDNAAMVLRYGEALEQARSTYDGLTVRYEDLATDTTAVAQRLCSFLGVGFEPQMLDYGRFDHGRYRPGLGDWKDKIKSGRVQPPAPLPAPEDVPPALRGLGEAWGYLPRADGTTPSRSSLKLPHPS